MSTKIYSAYRIKEEYSIEDVMEKIKKIKILYKSEIVNFLFGRWDSIKIANDIKDCYELSTYLKDVIKKGYNDYLNFSASVMVYFFEGRIYIQFFGLDGHILKTNFVDDIFDGMIEDYHYQNQSDPWWSYEDKEITKEQEEIYEVEWAERERVWDGILGDLHKFSDIGLAYDIFGGGDCFDISLDLNTLINNQTVIDE